MLIVLTDSTIITILLLLVSIIIAFSLGVLFSNHIRQYFSGIRVEAFVLGVGFFIIVLIILPFIFPPSVESIQTLSDWWSFTATLLLVLITGYYTLLTRKLALAESRKEHTHELKKFLEIWKKKIRTISDPEEPAENEASQTDYKKLEKDWRYLDLIEYHLPKKSNTLKEKWETLKRLELDYNNARHALYKNIENDIFERIPMTLCSLSPGTSTDRHHASVRFVYRQSLIWVKDSVVKVDRSEISLEAKSKEIPENQLKIADTVVFCGSEGEVETAKEVFQELMFEQKYLEKYQNEIRGILNLKKLLEIARTEVVHLIDEIESYPILPGINCERLS